jgi:hypothetical protein
MHESLLLEYQGLHEACAGAPRAIAWMKTPAGASIKVKKGKLAGKINELTYT